MSIKASGRWALIVAAGLWLCCAAPAQAIDGDAATSDSTAQTDSTADDAATAATPVVPNKPAKPRPKKHVDAGAGKPAKPAAKTPGPKKADEGDAAPNQATPSNVARPAANANAQLQAGDNVLKTMSVQAQDLLRNAGPATQTFTPNPPAANAEQAAGAQPGEPDRAQIQESANQPAPNASPNQESANQDQFRSPTLSMAVAPAPSDTGSLDSTWNRTSLAGKIFVGIGGLLTLASAARMFMA